MNSSLRWARIAALLRNSSSRGSSAFSKSATNHRFFTSTSRSRQQQYESQWDAARAAAKEKNRTGMYYGISAFVAFIGLSYGSGTIHESDIDKSSSILTEL